MTRLKDWWLDQWANHGTKILGYTTAIAGAWQTAILGSVIEASATERRIVAALVIILGTATVKRGHTNTANEDVVGDSETPQNKLTRGDLVFALLVIAAWVWLVCKA